MPSGFIDLVEAFFELLDFLAFWRFWVPFFAAVAIALLVLARVHDPLARSIVIVPIVIAGIVTGLVWHWKRG